MSKSWLQRWVVEVLSASPALIHAEDEAPSSDELLLTHPGVTLPSLGVVDSLACGMQPQIVLHLTRSKPTPASRMFSRADHGEVQRALFKDDRLLREQEVAELLAVAIATLRAWRRAGKPPAFIRLGRAVRYRLSDLHELIRNGGYRNEFAQNSERDENA